MSVKQNVSSEANQRGLELEYTTLRSEILKRIEMRQQIISVTLTLAGIFLSVGLSVESVVLIYPILAAFLAFGWAQNDFRIRDTAAYARENIEPVVPGLSYEQWVQKRRSENEGFGAWRFVVLSHGGVFIITQLLAIGIEITKLTPSTLEWFLFSFDVIAIVIVIVILLQTGRKSKKQSKKTPEKITNQKNDK